MTHDPNDPMYPFVEMDERDYELNCAFYAMTESYQCGLDAARKAVASTPMRMGAFNTKAADLAAIDALRKEPDD